MLPAAARRRRAAAVLAAGLVVSVASGGCARGDGGSDGDGGAGTSSQALEPMFAPESTGGDGDVGAAGGATAPASAPTTMATGSAPGGTAVPRPPAAPPASSVVPATTVAGGTAVPPTSAAIEDKQFDTTPSVLDPPPSWADLVGARLIRTSDGFELRVRLRGGAPETSGDDAHTMNVASFYDVDGDGSIDYEVWLNVASSGWGASYFDNTGGGRGGFQEKSGVTVGAEGGELVARFPLTHLAGATRFRWSLASEWGRYETIGTAAAVRDDLPDNDEPAPFPG